MPEPPDVSVTSHEADKWESALSDSLIKTLVILKTMPVNFVSFEFEDAFLVGLQENLIELNSDSKEADLMTIPGVETSLVEIECAVKFLDYHPGFHRKHINTPTTNRGFFIRARTCAFMQQTEKPSRKSVASAASAAFNISIDTREVIRTTKDLQLDERYRACK